MLENQGTNLLAFAVQLDRDLDNLAQDWEISIATAREVLEVQCLSTRDPKLGHQMIREFGSKWLDASIHVASLDHRDYDRILA